MSRAGIEINLPDLPEVPIRLGADGAAAAGPGRVPWTLRLREGLTAYLPLLLMVLLALGTWWLVKHTPPPPGAAGPKASRGEPDYTMRGFVVQRFGKDGQLRVRVEGRQLHHYPDTDRIEVEEVQLTAFSPDGRKTVATARRAVSNGKASSVDLMGQAQIKGHTPDGQNVEIDSEVLHFDTETERMRTDRPVIARVGADTLRAGGLRYDNLARTLELSPPQRAVLHLGGGAAR
jgi:lipopolysaccharide export system protein LptC